MLLTHTEQRLAGRLECRFPVRLTSGSRVVHAETVNLSRVGVLLEIPLAELDLEGESSLGVIGLRLTEVLGERATAEFRYDMLGGLIFRTVQVVRIAGAPLGAGVVLIGCALARALTDDEAGVLQLRLPPFLGRQQAAPAVPATDDAPIHAVLCSAHPSSVRPLLGMAHELTAQRMRAYCQDLRALSTRSSDRGVGAMLATMERGYGSLPTVVLMRDRRPRWSGAVRVQTVEYLAADGGLDIQMEFTTHLTVPEMASLGIG